MKFQGYNNKTNFTIKLHVSHHIKARTTAAGPVKAIVDVLRKVASLYFSPTRERLYSNFLTC